MLPWQGRGATVPGGERPGTAGSSAGGEEGRAPGFSPSNTRECFGMLEDREIYLHQEKKDDLIQVSVLKNGVQPVKE